MSTFTLFIAAIIQGITEFLPVSSSAHLFLWEHMQGVPANGFPYEMVLGAGTLLATVVYFRTELILMIRDVLKQCAGKGSTSYSHLAWVLILSTIPVCLVGFLLHDFISEHLRGITLMAAMLMLFGVFLGLSDKTRCNPAPECSTASELTITFKQGMIIGLAQILSLIPGASRSGTTITAARFLGLNRDVSVRFSFLLSIPVVIAATSLETIKVINNHLALDWFHISLGFAVSAIVGLLCIHILLRLITRVGFMPFAIYRVIMGTLILFYLH